MRQNAAEVRSGEERLISVAAEGVSRLKEAGKTIVPIKGSVLRYLRVAGKGVYSMSAAWGVLMLLVAVGLSAAFEAPYALRMLLLISFVVSFSLWAARDVIPDEKLETAILHEQIGFGVATIVLAIGVAGSFILRSANIWLLGALAALVISKSFLIAYRRGSTA